MVAGADSIEDMDLLRHGGMGRLFTGLYAPSTLGSSCARARSATCGSWMRSPRSASTGSTAEPDRPRTKRRNAQPQRRDRFRGYVGELPDASRYRLHDDRKVRMTNDAEAPPQDSDDDSWAVETRGLTKRFGGNVAVNGVDLLIPRGCAFGYLGPNGAGKTTLIRVLLGLTRADAGHDVAAGLPGAPAS